MNKEKARKQLEEKFPPEILNHNIFDAEGIKNYLRDTIKEKNYEWNPANIWNLVLAISLLNRNRNCKQFEEIPREFPNFESIVVLLCVPAMSESDVELFNIEPTTESYVKQLLAMYERYKL